MAVRERGDSWQADFSFAGKRYRETFNTKGEAEQWVVDSTSKLRKGESLAPRVDGSTGIDTMQQLMDATEARFWRGSKGEQTAVKNAQDCVDFVGPKVHPREVNTAVVDSMVAHFQSRNLSGATINRKLAALSKMMRFAFTRGWLTRLPTIERKKESEHRIRWLSRDEEAAVLKWFANRGQSAMEQFVTFLVDTGLRLSEGLNVRWEDVREGKVSVWGTGSKNAASRTVPLSKRVQAMLAERKKTVEGDMVWPDLSVNRVQWFWDQARDYLGKTDDAQFVVHALRHTFCSRLVQAGVSIQTVQKLAGHKNVTVTMRYAHLNDQNLNAAIELLQI